MQFAILEKHLQVLKREYKIPHDTFQLVHNALMNDLKAEIHPQIMETVIQNLKEFSTPQMAEVPKNTKFCQRLGNLSIYAIEDTPRCRTLGFNHCYKRQTRTYYETEKDLLKGTFYLSLPYVQYYVALLETENGIQSLTGAFPWVTCTKIPLTDWNQPVYQLPLPNITNYQFNCLQSTEQPPTKVAAYAEHLVKGVWSSHFKYWSGNYLLDIEDWAKKTEQDPQFILSYPLNPIANPVYRYGESKTLSPEQIIKSLVQGCGSWVISRMMQKVIHECQEK